MSVCAECERPFSCHNNTINCDFKESLLLRRNCDGQGCRIEQENLSGEGGTTIREIFCHATICEFSGGIKKFQRELEKRVAKRAK